MSRAVWAAAFVQLVLADLTALFLYTSIAMVTAAAVLRWIPRIRLWLSNRR